LINIIPHSLYGIFGSGSNLKIKIYSPKFKVFREYYPLGLSFSLDYNPTAGLYKQFCVLPMYRLKLKNLKNSINLQSDLVRCLPGPPPIVQPSQKASSSVSHLLISSKIDNSSHRLQLSHGASETSPVAGMCLLLA
jgi:hypothetical protein